MAHSIQSADTIMETAYSAAFAHQNYYSDKKEAFENRLDNMRQLPTIQQRHKKAAAIKHDAREYRRKYWVDAANEAGMDITANSGKADSVTSSVEGVYTKTWITLDDRLARLPKKVAQPLRKQHHSITIKRSLRQQQVAMNELLNRAQDLVAERYKHRDDYPSDSSQPGDGRSPGGTLRSAVAA